jgi:hypothetical protein
MSELHCKKCGNSVQPKDRFCRKCGSPLSTKTTVAEQTQSHASKVANNLPDYRIIEKKYGNVHGFWFFDRSDAENKEIVTALAIKSGLGDNIHKKSLLGNYEIWRNTFDSSGGYFVLFTEQLPTLDFRGAGERGRVPAKLGLVRCRCGSIYRIEVQPGFSLLCPCGMMLKA